MKLQKLSYFIALSLLSASALAALPNASSLNQTQNVPGTRDNLPLSKPNLEIPAATPSATSSSTDSDSRIVLKKIIFTSTGDAGISEQQAQTVVSHYLNRPLTLAMLHQMTDQLTRYYQQQGYLLGRALLLPQKITDNTLTIQLVAGSYASSNVDNSSSVKSTLIKRIVDNTSRKNSLIKTTDIQHMALLLQSIAGTESVVKFNAGDQFGSAEIQVTTKDVKRLSGYIGLDNQGDATIGKNRLFAGAQVTNLLGVGDSLNINLMDAYERSNLFSGNIGYSMMINPYGTIAGIDYSHLNYQYNLQGNKFNGHSDNYYLFIQHPLVLQPAHRVSLQARIGQQFLTDRFVIAENKKTNTFGSVEASGSFALPNNMGVASWSLTDTFGKIKYVQNIVNYDDNFNKINYKLDYQKQIYGPLSIYSKLIGQYSSNNLDPSQKFILGGPYGLRGYHVGEGSVDQGLLFTIELQNRFRLSDNYNLSLNAFFDQGSGNQYARPSKIAGVTQNYLNLSDIGLYAELASPGNFTLRLTVAKKTGQADPNTLQPKNTQFWFTAVKTF